MLEACLAAAGWELIPQVSKSRQNSMSETQLGAHKAVKALLLLPPSFSAFTGSDFLFKTSSTLTRCSAGHLHPIILSLPMMPHSAQALGLQIQKAPVTFSCSLWSVQPKQRSLPGGKFCSFIYLQSLKACKQTWDLPGARMKQWPEPCSNISKS